MYIGTYIQVLLDSAVLPILLDIMNTAEFKTRKEAVWAVCYAISGGTPEQVRFQLMFVSLYVYVHTVHICRLYIQFKYTCNIPRVTNCCQISYVPPEIF